MRQSTRLDPGEIMLNSSRDTNEGMRVVAGRGEVGVRYVAPGLKRDHYEREGGREGGSRRRRSAKIME